MAGGGAGSALGRSTIGPDSILAGGSAASGAGICRAGRAGEAAAGSVLNSDEFLWGERVGSTFSFVMAVYLSILPRSA